mgnify:CR=1 FL=1
MSNYAINLNTTTVEATAELFKLDDTFVGTEHYMGLAYFWSTEYKHFLRDASISQRKRIHNQALKLNLDFTEAGIKQWELIGKVLKLHILDMIDVEHYQKILSNIIFSTPKVAQ